MTWLCELDPGANDAPVCGASSWLWLVVVSVTETAGPDAACAAPELAAVSPAVTMSATAPSDAVMRLMRDMVLLRNSPPMKQNVTTRNVLDTVMKAARNRAVNKRLLAIAPTRPRRYAGLIMKQMRVTE